MVNPRTIRRVLKCFRDSIVTLVYPQDCAVCGGPVESGDDGMVCTRCWDDYEECLSDRIGCIRCGWPSSGVESAREPQDQCQHCRTLELDWFRCLGPYRGAIRAVVLSLKRQPYLPARVGHLLERRLPGELELLRCESIYPVPLHAKRARERGFNQAEVLAREVSRVAATPVLSRILERVVETRKHRAGIDARERSASLDDAFKLAEGRRLDGQSILLVDDVFTTGATMNECARTLRSAGASWICAFTLARVVD